MKVLVTGADGFIGRHLVHGLAAAGHRVVAASRTNAGLANADWRPMPDLGGDSDGMLRLDDCDAVVHLAGRAHVFRRQDCEETIFRRVNVEGSRRLAAEAARSGVRQVIFMSSAHAVAAESDIPIDEATVPRPESAYGRSKLAAEIVFKEVLEGSGCGLTILRPPLVYGPGSGANFARLVHLVQAGMPLPFAGIDNRRSFIGVQNLADLVNACLVDPRAVNRTFFPSDGVDLSTPGLLRALARALGKKDRLFNVPQSLLSAAALLPGMRAIRTLLASLPVDSTTLIRELEWRPRLDLDTGLRLLVGAIPYQEDR